MALIVTCIIVALACSTFMLARALHDIRKDRDSYKKLCERVVLGSQTNRVRVVHDSLYGGLTGTLTGGIKYQSGWINPRFDVRFDPPNETMVIAFGKEQLEYVDV